MLWLTQAQADRLIGYARQESPNEVCGILAGIEHRVMDIVPITNAASDPQRTYYMDERELARALMTLEARSLSLLAFYHSHPNGDPIPSPVDVQHAYYPDTPYLIVGLRSHPQIAAWLLRYGQTTPVPVHIGLNPPEASARMTKAQKVAILISALIAFALLIVLSLSLLPPAPPVP
jgi:proteasome lid subunit RPN8/RPN11